MKQKDILIIIFLLFIFVLFWIGGNIYHSGINSTISEDTTQNIAPIAPNFDTKAIDKLKTRERIVPLFELGNPTPTPISLPLAAPLNASQGGKLLL